MDVRLRAGVAGRLLGVLLLSLGLSAPAASQGTDLRKARKPMIVAAQAGRMSPSAVPGCPDQGGLLDSITVPVDQPLELSVRLSAPAPEGGASFNVLSDNPAFVAAGDRVQGFIPTVFVPEGDINSNPFTLYGIAVGQTRLRLIALTPGYGSGSYPLGAWDINKSGSGRDQKFVDANAPGKSCRVTDSAELSTTPATQASCGAPVRGVASDGTNALLLRSVSGLAGTACFEIVSPAGDDPGEVRTPLTGTVASSGLNYGFSYFTPPKHFGSSTAPSRKVTVEFTFTPNIGNGNTSRLRADLDIVRPPVVLVHGLWSDGSTWSRPYLRNDGPFTTTRGDYAGTSASSFTVNAAVVKDAVTEALTTIRKKGYAATQSDVVGHSMGGLLTRRFVDASDYKRPDNFDRGDVRRLLSLDTPHWGSSFANLLVSLHNVDAATAARVETTVNGLTGGDMLAGAVCDLSENSPALAQLAGGTALRAQAISASGGPGGTPQAPARYWGGVWGLKSFEGALTDTYCVRYFGPFCQERAFSFPQDRVDAFRFQEANDAVVSVTSQGGGLAGINFADPIHFKAVGRGVTESDAVTTRVHTLLDDADSAFAASLPAVPADGSGVPRVGGTPTDAADYAAQCATGGPMKPTRVGAAPSATPRAGARRAMVDPRIRILAPAAGAVVNPGTELVVTVELSPPLTESNTVGVTLVGFGRLEATWVQGLQFQVTTPPLPPITGALTLVPDLIDTQGTVLTGVPTTVALMAPAAPVSIALQQSAFQLRPGSLPRQLYVDGRLADGSVVDLRAAVTGTRYASSNTDVVTVGADGLVSIVGAGTAAVTVSHGALSASASFVVQDPANPLPPTQLTGQFQLTRGGIRLDRNTGFYVQQVTVRNTSNAPVPVPLYLVLSGLPAGVTLVSKSGLTEQLAPSGRPYIVMRPAGDGLTMTPGAALNYTFQFLNPTRVNIGYTLDVVGGTDNP